MTITDWIQAISTVVSLVVTAVLVAVTVAYVKRTAEIAKATEKQAEASVKMAEALSKPAIFPQFDTHRIYAKDCSIAFANLGNGPALRGELKVAYIPPSAVERAWKDGTEQYGSLPGVQDAKWTIIKPAEDHRCYIELVECNSENVGSFFAVYSDVYGRRILSGWGYRCEDDGKGNIYLDPTEPIYPVIKEGVD
ncbi:MAG: hypothetical protein HYX84_02665 [Chloroflexi bacterium]|nr:hypothetical protein [Chloroflexota bacterium]